MVFNPMMGNMVQMYQQLRTDPVGTLKKAGYNVPDGVTGPDAILKHLMDSGQVSQQQYNQAQQRFGMVQQLLKGFK